MDATPPNVDTAQARLAALTRHRSPDDAAIRAARRDLEVARAAAMTAAAIELLRGNGAS